MIAAVVVLPLAVALAACSGGSGGGATTTVTVTASTSPTTESPTTESPTTDPTTTTDSPTTTETTSGSPTSSTVSPTSGGQVLGITVSFVPQVATVGQRVDITGTTDRSLAGQRAYTVKVNDGAPRALGSGVTVGSAGTVRSYVSLQRTGVLRVVVPATPIPAGAFDPATPLLASSADFTVTVH